VRIAFYAPLKSPRHPVPSGDRSMARLFVAALRAAGHAVEVASAFRSFDGGGDPSRQRRLAALGAGIAERLRRRYHGRLPGERPALWFTYHLYHKAPDWLGPPLSRALQIPYVVAEASHAPKQANGRWAAGHRAAARAIAAADRVLALTSADVSCLAAIVRAERLVRLRPFIDVHPWVAAAAERDRHRRLLSARLGIDAGVPWLIAVAMMRPGDKLASYGLLGRALAGLLDRPWRLLVAGDGPAAAAVDAALAPLGRRVQRLGLVRGDPLAQALAAADLCVWPAVGEAYGLALLEAQAAACPVVAGRTGGVPEVVADGVSGVLVPVGDADAFAAAVADLLARPAHRREMGEQARARALREHHIDAASADLGRLLAGLAAEGAVPHR
jgi:glycosyltransferase involved in cell wall biosynthesis